MQARSRVYRVVAGEPRWMKTWFDGERLGGAETEWRGGVKPGKVE